MPPKCACGCGGDLPLAKYPSQQAVWLRGHNRAAHAQPSISKRFWSHVDKTDGCWLWTGADKGALGHGRFYVKGKRTKVHRFSWELANGPIPPGLFVLHRCDNGACVRPDHLFLGTQADNIRDMDSKGRRGRRRAA